MNRLPLETRIQVLAALCEGASIRATCRMTGVAKGTVLKLLADVGDACGSFHFMNVGGIRCKRVQLDEIWSFCYAKDRNVPEEMRGEYGVGSMWTWVGIDPDSKLVISWLLGNRDDLHASSFVQDLRARIVGRVQITTDGLALYRPYIERFFGGDADYGVILKEYGIFGSQDRPDTRYSPMVCTAIRKMRLNGSPDPEYITTSHVERQNLTMRMSMRRFTRLTNAFSKKAENLNRALALHFVYYNFVRKHGSIKTTPAIAAGLTDRIWTLHDLANLPDLLKGEAA
jgi:IS1 family transposase